MEYFIPVEYKCRQVVRIEAASLEEAIEIVDFEDVELEAEDNDVVIIEDTFKVCHDLIDEEGIEEIVDENVVPLETASETATYLDILEEDEKDFYD